MTTLRPEEIEGSFPLEPGNVARAGTHLCCVFGSEEEHLTLLTVFVRRGLERGEKVLCVVDRPPDADALRQRWRDLGLDIEAYLATGQMRFLTSEEVFLQGGEFDPGRVIGMLEAATDRAITEGYPALRVTSGTAWVHDGRPGFERLLDFERQLESRFSGRPFTALCRFDRRRCSTWFLQSILACHGAVLEGPAATSRVEVATGAWPPSGASAEMLSRALDSAADNIVVTDRNGAIQYVNPAFETITGYTLDEAKGRTPAILKSGLHTEAFYESLWGVIVAGGVFRACFANRKKNGDLYFEDKTVAPVRDSNGAVAQFISVGRDVTGARKAERGVIEGVERYQALVAASAQMEWIAMPDGSIVEISGWPAITGQTVDEARGWGWLAAVHPGDRDRVDTDWRRAVREVRTCEIEYRLRTANGTYRRFALRLVPVLDPSGGVREWIGACTDITEQRAAEETVRRQAEILEQTQESVVATDMDGFVTSWNKGAERLFGYSTEEVLGRHISFVYPGDQHEFLRHSVIAPTQEQGRHEIDVEMCAKSGRRFFANLTLSLLRDEAGEPIGMIGFSTDITDHKRAEAELRTRAREQAAISDLGQRALAGADLPDLLSAAVKMVAEILGVEYCKILERLPEGDECRLVAGVGWQEGLIGRIAVGTGPTSQAGFTLQARGPVIVKDITSESRFSAPPLLRDHGVVSGLSVVIQGWEKPFGVLGAHSSQRRNFTADEVNFVQAVANVIAGAIARKKAEAELRTRALEQREIAELGLLALAGSDINMLMSKAVVLVARMLAVDLSKILELMPDGERLILRTGVGWEQGLIGHATVEAGDGSMAGFTLLAGSPIVVEDVRTEARFRIAPLLREHGVVSGLSVVIHGWHRPFGILGADSRQRRTFTQDDIHFMQAVANVIGEAIERKRAESSQARLAAILEATPDFVAVSHRDGKVLYINRAGRKMIGTDERGDITAIPDCYPEWVNRTLVDEAIPVAVREGVWSGETALLHRDGREIPVSQVVLAHKDANGAVEFISTIARDISKRRDDERKIHAYQEKLRSLASELSLAEEKERRRIATGLHDHIAQTLAAVKIKLGALQARESDRALNEEMSEIRELLERTIQSTRSLSFELSPPLLYDLGFQSAVEWLADRVEQEHDLVVQVEDDGQPSDMDEGLRVLLFTTVRELLLNVVKHAEASQVRISIATRPGGMIHIEVVDDGKGFDAALQSASIGRTGGFGLFSVRERLGHLGGRLVVESAVGRGTRALVIAPLGASTRTEG